MSGEHRRRFFPQRLTLARELRGLTKTELAARINKTAGAISHFEGGRSQPDPATVGALTLALGVPREFFHTPLSSSRLGLDDCNFRSLRSASQRERRQLLAFGTLLSEAEAVLSEHVQLPKVNLETRPLSESETMEERATELRREWGLGDGPVHEVSRLLERNGIVVALIPNTCERVDAFSCWQGEQPFTFIVETKPPSRQRFDAMHEVGHLLLHVDAIPGDKGLELEANSFAAAFLMPRAGLLPHVRGMRPTLEAFYELKKHWGVSAAALIRRAFDLRVIGESAYRRLYKRLTMTGARKQEPYEIAQSPPTLLSQAAAQSPGVATVLCERLGVRGLELEALLQATLPSA